MVQRVQCSLLRKETKPHYANKSERSFSFLNLTTYHTVKCLVNFNRNIATDWKIIIYLHMLRIMLFAHIRKQFSNNPDVIPAGTDVIYTRI